VMGAFSKPELRRLAREKRTALAASLPDFAAEIAAFAAALEIAPGTVVGGYHALPEEADPRSLLAALAKLGCHIAFPRVTTKKAPLEFHHVSDGEVLKPGAFGVAEPLAHWPVARPFVLLVPLLAFDETGHRLGYGGGYYDRTLAALKPRAVGIAFSGQQVDALPKDVHDYPLDAILTEHGLTNFA
jgi:5-formyltetrahydrofolate cyclo-ligase